MSGSTWSSFIIKNTGELQSAGLNSYGQLGQTRNNGTSNPNRQFQNVNLNNPRQVAAGYYHTMVVTLDGKLYGMGYNYYGQLGIATNWQNSNSLPVPTYIMDGVKQVACGYHHTLILMSNGDLYSTGYNAHGELGTGDSTHRWQPIKVMSGVELVAAGAYHSVAIKANGDMYTCGYNRYGQLARSQNAGSSAENQTFLLAQTGVRMADCGNSHTLFIKQNGDAYACGYNYYGQLATNIGYNTDGAYWNPVLVKSGCKSVACGPISSYFLTDANELWAVGYNGYGCLGDGTTSSTYIMKKTRTGVRQVVSGYYHVLALDLDGKLYSVGYNNYGALGVPSNVGGSNTNPDWIYITDNVSSLWGNQSLIILNNFTCTPSFHKENVRLTLNVDHPSKLNCQYRILVGNGQKYPASGWTALQPPPYSIIKDLPHTDFQLGNNIVVIEVKDIDGQVSSLGGVTTKINQAPSVGTPTLSGSVVHKQSVTVNAILTDAEGDSLQYRIFLNGVQKYPSTGYTNLAPSPVVVSWVFNNSDLIVGSNNIKIEVVDDLGTLASWSGTVIKTNIAPQITSQLYGSFLDAEIKDSDVDVVQYRILVNGVQTYPEEGYTEFLTPPVRVKYRVPKAAVKFGQSNKIRLEVRDDLGGSKSWEGTFIGGYDGLMFCDANESFYSTDFGEIIKYLDFGTIIAGQTTTAERVWVKNLLGYPVGHIKLWVDQGELDGETVKAEISKLDAPFQPMDTIEFEETLPYNEKISFYVRVVSTRPAKQGGMFDMKVKATPQ